MAVLLALHLCPLNPALDALLSPSPGCSAKGLCFMGVYPGATTIDQAAGLLSAHPWVAEIDTHLTTQITWTWSGVQPAYIDAGVPGSMIMRDYAHISLIRVKTRYNYGDIWLQLGTPAQGYAMRQPEGFLHGVYYTRYSMLAINFTECPAQMINFWSTPVTVQFGDAFIMLNDHYREQSARFRAC